MAKTQKTAKNKSIKSNSTCFFDVKSLLIPPRIDASMILEQDLMKKNIGFGGLDGSGMEVDDEIVSRGSNWLFHLMEQSIGT